MYVIEWITTASKAIKGPSGRLRDLFETESHEALGKATADAKHLYIASIRHLVRRKHATDYVRTPNPRKFITLQNNARYIRIKTSRSRTFRSEFLLAPTWDARFRSLFSLRHAHVNYFKPPGWGELCITKCPDASPHSMKLQLPFRL